ncbi:UDP-2,3-diacylglucosamine diphosphatase [Sulfurovum riftiae]|uniref:UDP-2,3-diacylglucosamine hydrolase n=1 Tax=Sulfurovum riftiae TaxID=1630136 RepID=A0A151CJM9_9BACT|nr:metallophosphoesterase [Sulfurovum riftiae]KYJ87736.1 UDP-2,3-diacylglucosamine hydrolase [Sulfurovum riftiae]
MIEIKEGALFIADSHYPHHGDLFLDLLKKLHNSDIKIPQLFLMGDNFDLLFGYNDYIQTFASEAIELLQSLSKNLEIHYFEGNHDFCLKALFPDIHVYPRELQPVMFVLGEKKVGISHGDRYATGFGYDLYCSILRSKRTLTLLKPWEHAIIDHQMKVLSQKKICRTFTDFEKRVEKIMESYAEVDLVIEGHYHQARVIGNYISLPSLACQGEVCIVQKGKAVFVKAESL